MKEMIKRLCFAAACGAGVWGAGAQNVLDNASFETTCPAADRWSSFGNVSSINFYTNSGARAIKMFGPFCCPLGYSGLHQDTPAAAGQTWEASAFVTNPSWDQLSWNADTGSGSRAFIEIVFLDVNGSVLFFPQQNISAKLDHHTDFLPIQQVVGPVVAPEGTASVRMQAIVEQGNYVGGAAWYDDLTLNQVGQPNALGNSSVEDQGPGCLGSPFRSWVNFGNGQGNYGESPRSGNYAAKLFGGYNAPTAASGWFQEVGATPHSHWKASGWGITRGNDLIQAGNDVFISFEFFDSDGNNISEYETHLSPYRSSAVPTGAANDLVYHFYETAEAEAPDFTAKVRVLIFQRQVNYAGGATWWDDIELVQTDLRTCFADFNQDGGITGDDVAAFFEAFEAGDTAADTNIDGGIDGSDVETFFLQFEAGGC